MFFGPLGALCVMDAPTFTAEDAERAEKDRITVASHLVCDVDVRRPRIWNDVEPERRRQAPTLHPAFLGGLGALCVMRAVSRQERKGRKGLQGEEQGSGSDALRSSWRSWRAWRDAVNPTPRSDSHAKNAKGAKKDRFWTLCSSPWRAWRPMRDGRADFHRRGRRERQVLDSLLSTLALLASFA